MTKNCPDCAVPPGQPHANGCDVARCPCCGGQLLGCDCSDEELEKFPKDIWTGEWPGVAECRKRNWYSYCPGNGTGWRRCAKDYPGATEDLNRLAVETRWNSKTKTYEDRT